MAFFREDAWVWDFWFAVPGGPVGEIHLFYLFAPRSLGDPELRHQNARIGHAVSSDLRSWRDLGAALPPAVAGGPDDRASWTGCVVRDHDGRWRMFHTGISEAEDGTVQRVIEATSGDLMTWERSDLCVEADERCTNRRTGATPGSCGTPRPACGGCTCALAATTVPSKAVG